MFLILFLIFSDVFSYAGQGPFLFSKMKYQAFPSSHHPGSNCVSNCVLAPKETHNCSVGQPKRDGYSIIEQLENSKVPAILLAPEVAYDQQSSTAGGFAIKERSSHIIGDYTLSDIKRIIVFSHSGAYNTIASILSVGGVPQTREAVLLDSLYGRFPDFNDFIDKHLEDFGNGQHLYRYANIYTDGGGTNKNSVEQAERTRKLVKDNTSLFFYDNTHSTLPPAAYIHPIIFKRSKLGHNDVPRYYVERFLKVFLDN